MGESLKREAAYTYLFMSCCQQAMWVGVMVFHAVEIHYYLKSIGCNIRIWEQLWYQDGIEWATKHVMQGHWLIIALMLWKLPFKTFMHWQEMLWQKGAT